MNIPKNNQLTAMCALVGASIYGIAAILTLMAIMNFITFPVGALDPISALLLAIVAAVFAGAVEHLLKNNLNGYAFLVVGTILAGLLFALQSIILGANTLGWLLQLDDWLNWSLVDDLTLQFWLFPLVVPILGLPWIIDYGSRLKNKEGDSND